MKKIAKFRILIAALFLMAFVCLSPRSAFAGTVAPSGETNKSDAYAINSELERTGSVQLQPGGTYYLGYYISLNSNYTIDATGATLIINRGAVRNSPSNYKTDYSSMSNVKIKGGTWLSESKKGFTGTSFSFAHCNNITLEDMDIRCANAEGHAIELVGCSNVTIRNCNIIAQGKGKAKSVEEMVQIDLAAPHTSPFLDKKYQNGLACKNITVTGCTVTGNRAVCANFAAVDPKYKSRYHQNITITNNTLTGTVSEGLALFNTVNAKITGNTIISKSKRLRETYSSGCRFSLYGKIRKAAKSKIVVQNNTIKGGSYGFLVGSGTSSRFGKVIVKKNKLYSKRGKKNALVVSATRKVVKGGNKLGKW